MILKDIALENFTNYEQEHVELDGNINIFIGENAQGKSNLLEGIHYLSNISSSRNHKDKELIKWGSDAFNISAHFSNRLGDNEVEIRFVNNKKEVYLNNCKIEKKKDYIGYFITILFTPEDLTIIKGDPSLRRAYIDDELMATDVEYFLSLYKYRKILEQRNNLLKDFFRKRSSDAEMEAWEEHLVDYGTKILLKRLEMFDKIKELARATHAYITDESEQLKLEYSSRLDLTLLREGEKEKFASYYREALKENRSKDIERGFTSLGPHRDDLEIFINDVSAKKFGSQGQQRTAALSLKIAEIEFVKGKTGEYPLLLLDDVLSELDKKRKNKLLSAIRNKVQTIITTTELNEIEEDILQVGKIIRIRNGKVQ